MNPSNLPPNQNMPRLPVPGMGLPLPGMNPGLPVPAMGLPGLPVPGPSGPPIGLPMPGLPSLPKPVPLGNTGPSNLPNPGMGNPGLSGPTNMMLPVPNPKPQTTMINPEPFTNQRGPTGPQVPIGMQMGANLPNPPQGSMLGGPTAGKVPLGTNGPTIPLSSPNSIPLPPQGGGNNLPQPPFGMPQPSGMPYQGGIGKGLPGPGGLNLPPGPGMNFPPGPGMNLPPGPGMNFPPGPGMNLPPGPGMNFPHGPGMNLPPGPGMNFPPGPGMNFPPPSNMPGSSTPKMPMGMNPPLGLPGAPNGMNIANLPVPPNFPAAPKLPGSNFPPVPPQSFPPPNTFSSPDIIIGSNPSISIKRVGLSEANMEKAQNDGRFNQIINKNPGVSLYSNSAGLGQAYINIVGSPQAVNSSYSALKNMEHQDSQWYFLDDDGSFKPYESNLNKLIENGFSNGDECTEIFANSKPYLIYYGQNNSPHQQLLQGGQIYRTVRRGRDPSNQNFNSDLVKWFWADETTNQWKNYEPEACQLIESHYQNFVNKFRGRNLSAIPNKEEIAKTESVLVSGTSGFSYLMDFVNMVQRNEKTRRWRAIKKDGLNCQFRVSQVKPEPTPWVNHPDPQLG